MPETMKATPGLGLRIVVVLSYDLPALVGIAAATWFLHGQVRLYGLSSQTAEQRSAWIAATVEGMEKDIAAMKRSDQGASDILARYETILSNMAYGACPAARP